MGDDSGHWSVLIPVKRLAIAKTRLALDAVTRAHIALAMASDTVRAAVAAEAVGEVIVITDDAQVTTTMVALGARVIADRPDAGINPALRYGADAARCGLIAALAADLPALQAPDLTTILTLAASHPTSTVSDLAGTGTTLFAAVALAGFAPAFGSDSRSAHLAAGAFDLTTVAPTSVRHDVDTRDALRHAVDLGLGPSTTLALAELSDVDL